MIALIAAVARNGVIGKDGKIPWRCSEDLKRFKALTMGGVLVMGRKTHESIGKVLPGRITIVVSKSVFDREGPHRADLNAAPSLRSALEYAAAVSREAVFICGGAEVYREALEVDIVDRLYLTRIHADYDGDTFMPEIDYSRWARVSEEEAKGASVPHSYLVLDRKR